MERKVTARTAAYEADWRMAWIAVLLVSLVSIGKNFSTVDLAVTMSDVQAQEGWTSDQISLLIAGGYAFSIGGKAVGGYASDTFGGKLTCIGGMLVYACATALFAVIPRGSPFFVYVLLWGLNVMTSLGVLGVSRVTLASNWIPQSMSGRMMSLVSMSTDLGDAVSRVVLTIFLSSGWRSVFCVSAALCFLTGAPLALIREFPESGPETAKEEKSAAPEHSFWQKVKPLLSSPMLYALCMLSGVLYGTRVLFLNYTANFLSLVRCRGEVSAGRVSDLTTCMTSGATLAAAAAASSMFTLVGCASPLLVGSLKDALPKRHRAVPLIAFVLPLVLTLSALALFHESLSYYVAVTLMTIAGACIAGPFKVIGPVFAVDVAGKEGKGTAVSLVGMCNNAAGVGLILLKGFLGSDWGVLFSVLATLSLVSVGIASWMWKRDLSTAQVKVSTAPLLPTAGQ